MKKNQMIEYTECICSSVLPVATARQSNSARSTGWICAGSVTVNCEYVNRRIQKTSRLGTFCIEALLVQSSVIFYFDDLRLP